MPKLPASDEQIERIRAEKRTWFIHPRIRRLALRVAPPNDKYQQGKKSWYLINPQHNFGAFPAMKLKAAIATAEKLVGQQALGTDLGAEKKKAREARDEANATTLADIAELFKSEHVSTLKDGTRAEWTRYIDQDIVPRWGKKDMVQAAWRKAEIKSWLTETLATRGVCVANDIYACMRRLFSWANDQEHIGEWTPFLNLERPAPMVERDRVLSLVEIKKVLAWIRTEPLVFRAAWMTFFWTLARHRPVANMKAIELDLDSAKWTFRDKGKGKGKYRIAPLPAQAVKLYRIVLDANGEDCEYVFDSGHAKRNRSFETKSYRYQIALQASLGRCRAATKIDDFKGAHDIRRTMATRLAEEEFADENLIARILGHGLPGVEPHTLIYQRYARLNEQRKALQRLADWLDTVDQTDVGKLSKMTLAHQTQAV